MSPRFVDERCDLPPKQKYCLFEQIVELQGVLRQLAPLLPGRSQQLNPVRTRTLMATVQRETQQALTVCSFHSARVSCRLSVVARVFTHR